MPTVKIAEPPAPPCSHPEHRPPGMRVFSPGTYKHTCPACGATSVFVVPPGELKATLGTFSLPGTNPPQRRAYFTPSDTRGRGRP